MIKSVLYSAIFFIVFIPLTVRADNAGVISGAISFVDSSDLKNVSKQSFKMDMFGGKAKSQFKSSIQYELLSTKYQSVLKKRKSPAIAFSLSFFPPLIVPIQGLGYFYIGQHKKGITFASIGLISGILMISSSSSVINDSESDSVAGLLGIIYVGSWIISSIDSYKSAKKVNSRTINASKDNNIQSNRLHKVYDKISRDGNIVKIVQISF